MTVLIRIQGRDFVPLAAVPTVTNDVVTVEDIIRQMANADVFADPDHELLPAVLQVMPNGEIRPVSEGEFRRWCPRVKDVSPKMPISESASILVRANELKALFKLLRESDCSVGPSRFSRSEWDEACELPEEVAAAIRVNCLNYLLLISAQFRPSIFIQI